jgi:CNT family concentrative nucleoside transporter
MAASVMSAPAALVMAKIVFPETKESLTSGDVKLKIEKKTANIVDAAASGAADGLRLAVNVGAMLLAFIALVALIDYGLGLAGGLVGYPQLNLKTIFGFLFYPLGFCMGVEWGDLFQFGNLLGTKIAINELVAYTELTALKDVISERSYIIATYALCGFANFSSIAIQIGGISSVAPERRQDLAKLGIRAMFAGALASWLTATIAGLLI